MQTIKIYKLVRPLTGRRPGMCLCGKGSLAWISNCPTTLVLFSGVKFIRCIYYNAITKDFPPVDNWI